VGRTRVRAAVDERVLALLLAASVARGTLGREWNGPARLLGELDRWQTTVVGAASSVVLNNLPAAVLLRPNRHATRVRCCWG